MLATRIRHTGKLRRNLRPNERWVYVCVLTIAGEAAPRGAFLIGGQEPTAADMADEAAVSLPVARKALGLLRQLGLLEQDATGIWWVRDFDGHNPTPRSDRTNAERQRRYRERNGESNGTGNETLRNADNTDEEKRREEKRSNTPPAPPDGEERQGEKSRPEVEGLCQHLADLIIANGARPGQTVVTDSWRRECRLLLDRDGVAPDRVRAVIDWCQADEFWKTNVLSMPKLREKFDQLSAKEQATRPKARPARRMHPATTEELRQLNERKTA